MTFSDRLRLEEEYKLWLEHESQKVGTTIDGTRLSTMLIFLESKEMLVKDTPEKRTSLTEHLVNRGAVTVDWIGERRIK